MAKDVLFKTTAFGGFKKNEVMEYIQNILSEKSNLENQLAVNSAQTAQLSSRVRELTAEIEETAALRSELADKTVQITDFEEKIKENEALITQLSRQIAEAENNIAVADSEENSALRAENERLKNELEKLRGLERQVGAAMLDARVHSEELVEAAKERAQSVTKSIYNAIGETAVKIDDLSAGIGDIAREFTKSAEEIELRIKVLTGDMSKTAQALISDSSLLDNGTPSLSDNMPVIGVSGEDK